MIWVKTMHFRNARKAFALACKSSCITAIGPNILPSRCNSYFGNKHLLISRRISSEEDERSDEILQTKHRRLSVIHDPALNRGSGFSVDERERLLLRGLVPPRRQGLDQQIERVMKTYERQKSDLDKFQFLSLLMDRNNVLFYRILVDNFEKLAPIVYTPVVGEACQKFHAIYRRTRGMYFSLDDRPHFRTMVFNWPEDDVDVIVVTDGSRVLALGTLS